MAVEYSPVWYLENSSKTEAQRLKTHTETLRRRDRQRRDERGFKCHAEKFHGGFHTETEKEEETATSRCGWVEVSGFVCLHGSESSKNGDVIYLK